MSFFISYRRKTSLKLANDLAEALRDALAEREAHSEPRVFLDQTGIDPGLDYVRCLDEEVASCDLFLALVDSAYFDQRFDAESDFVRRELRIALQQKRTIVPVVIDQADWPPLRPLPSWVEALDKTQAVFLKSQENAEIEKISHQLASLHTAHRPLDLPNLHQGGVNALAVGYLGDRPVLVSSGEDGVVRRTSLSPCEQYGPPLRLHPQGRTALALVIEGSGPDTRVVAGFADATVAVWELATGKLIVPARPESAFGAMCTVVTYVWQKHGRRLVYANSAGEINLWPTDSNGSAYSGLPIFALAHVASNAGDGLLIAGREFLEPTGIGEFLEIRDLETGERLARRSRAHEGLIRAVLVNRTEDKLRMISAGDDGMLLVWDDDLRLLAAAGPHDGGVTALMEFAGALVSGGRDGTVRSWSMTDFFPLGRPKKEHVGEIACLACATIRGRRIVISGGRDGAARAFVLESLYGDASKAPLPEMLSRDAQAE